MGAGRSSLMAEAFMAITGVLEDVDMTCRRFTRRLKGSVSVAVTGKPQRDAPKGRPKGTPQRDAL